MGQGMHRKRDAVGDAGFAHQAGDMRLDGAFFDVERRADFFVGTAGDQQQQDFPLPFGPTTTVIPGSNSSTVGSAKDLNPFMLSDFRNICGDPTG